LGIEAPDDIPIRRTELDVRRKVGETSSETESNTGPIIGPSFGICEGGGVVGESPTSPGIG
jgi:hypothetical protein